MAASRRPGIALGTDQALIKVGIAGAGCLVMALDKCAVWPRGPGSVKGNGHPGDLDALAERV